MKRSGIDALRRGLDDTLANWPLILLRVGEAIVLTGLAIAGVILLIVPIAVSIGLSMASLSTPENVENAIALLMTRWALLLWIFGGISIALIVFVAIHSFVEAGAARVYVDAEKIAGPPAEGPRARFAVFSMERWLAGGAAGWWTVFWIYNLAWGVAGLVMILPLVPTALLVILFAEQPPLLLGAGCFGLAATLIVMLFVGIVTGAWTNRAIVEWAAKGTGASVSLSSAWRAFRADAGRHLLVAVVAIVVGMAGSSFFASFSLMAAFGETLHAEGLFNIVTMPMRLLASLGSMAFSAAVSSWFLASFATLATE